MAWKKPSGQKRQNGNKGTPGPKALGGPQPTPPQVAVKTHYQELQENEVMVLKAIYGDDFAEHETANGAWKVCGMIGWIVYLPVIATLIVA